MSKEKESRLAHAIELINGNSIDQAIIELQKLVKDYPEFLEGWYNLGYSLSVVNRNEAALKAYEEALSIDNQIFEIWFNKGTLHYEIREFKKAIECLEKAVEIKDDDAEAWNNLGTAYSRLGNGEKAIEAYTRAVALRPDYAEALYNKANAHFIEGHHERAVAFAELAMQLKPSLTSKIKEWLHISREHLAAVEAESEFEKKASKLKDAIEE
ncbi:MAG: hypothetical protein BAJATHORv1_30412 [Candidatus Thorarchaeota archaeon]|nr:MAG: hypothetical protein BAJATHORv1_30412 [Candidatus Thorarchaeota archaeon]